MERIVLKLYVEWDSDYLLIKDKDDWETIRCCKFGPASHKEILKYTTQAAPEGKHQYWVKKGRVFAINLLDLADHNYLPWDAIKLGIETAKNSLNAGRHVLVQPIMPVTIVGQLLL